MIKPNSGPIFSADRLRSFVERIELLEEERRAIGGDIRDVYSDAKGVGYDVKIMRKVVQLRKMDAADRDEQEQLLDVYWHALSTVDRIEARAAAGESAREIATAENVSKSTAHRVSQKARTKNDDAETGQEAPAAREVVCVIPDSPDPCPNTCAREGRCAWDGSDLGVPSGRVPRSDEQEAPDDPGEEPAEFFRADVYQMGELVLTNELGAVAEGDSPQRVATDEIDLTPPPRLLEKRREIEARRAAT